MSGSKSKTIVLPFVLIGLMTANSCNMDNGATVSSQTVNESSRRYVWTKVTEQAAYPPSYNFPVYVANNRMWAFHQQGIWDSADGKTWTKSKLPAIRRDAYETRYVQFRDAVYALGENRGNYLDIKFGSKIRRTTDFQKWETLAEESNFPSRIFYSLLVFNDKLWLLAGYDGKNYYNDVWNSADGVTWARVTEHAAWSPRMDAMVVAFKNRIYLGGGGVIDGTPNDNPDSSKEVWSSADGINWTKTAGNLKKLDGGSAIVFDGKVWFVGPNRNDGVFGRATLSTDDFVNWKEESAPWSPRRGTAAWIFDGKLYMTGGKYSVTENGNIRYIYSNDVWYLSAS